MKLLISGSSGMIGQRLLELADVAEHECIMLVRRQSKAENERSWDPESGMLDPGVFDGIDAVVHLAGDNIGSGRWTAAKKRRIRDSRVMGTKLLAERMALANGQPALVCASAIGFYGDRGDEKLTEDSPAGTGFLADVCKEWEAAADAARDAGLRVVHNRLGIVLSSQGGALASMLTPFRMGVGGNMGSGRQYWSWIELDDAANAFLYAAENATLTGPVNVVAPQPATNAEFTKVLGSVLHRPTIFPMPAFMARLVLGEMAEALILSSARVLPGILQERHFEYRNPTLEEALRAALE